MKGIFADNQTQCATSDFNAYLPLEVFPLESEISQIHVVFDVVVSVGPKGVISCGNGNSSKRILYAIGREVAVDDGSGQRAVHRTQHIARRIGERAAEPKNLLKVLRLIDGYVDLIKGRIARSLASVD